MKVDKSKWDDGPWKDEPDSDDWIESGITCRMLRHPEIGHWCGYIAIPKGHPWFGIEPDLEVHGGITYAKAHAPHTGDKDGNWWLGWDYAHAFDLNPGMSAIPGISLRAEDHYWTYDEVQAEVTEAARQAVRVMVAK